ncbi:hypothetical protein HDG35_002623 [Paraburkholderia sp. JPY681]|uniref:Uncharacterized protein n=1 Tax=Paraburkholderia atlantica TaxID=2654982 RepID=D5W9N7_PARAM|nr:hypothetical protein [Paraburkholderia atlantica]ADG16092.1 conserved hypothetical protein [Paraburkholderia atlantica]MBB5506372.1 hypothetical protein [Paraburkholderia atlantica]
MRKTRFVRVFAGMVLLALVVSVAAFNVINLNETYGSGEPYYSRTTNMDKWTDPLPMLGVVDGVAAAVVAAGVFLWRRMRV